MVATKRRPVRIEQENEPPPTLEWRSLQHARKVLHVGDVVKCAGHRGRFTIKSFGCEPGATTARCWSGDRWRVFDCERLTVDRAATRRARA